MQYRFLSISSVQENRDCCTVFVQQSLFSCKLSSRIFSRASDHLSALVYLNHTIHLLCLNKKFCQIIRPKRHAIQLPSLSFNRCLDIHLSVHNPPRSYSSFYPERSCKEKKESARLPAAEIQESLYFRSEAGQSEELRSRPVPVHIQEDRPETAHPVQETDDPKVPQ